MVLPFEECRSKARDSGSKSRTSLLGDPVSSSSRSGLQDGLFGRVHHLDDEDPAALAALRERYFNENQPRDAVEEFLVNECYIGDVLGQRFKRAQKNYQSTFYRAFNALEARRKREVAARAAREPDIKPPAPDGECAAGPSAAPEAVTQVVGDTPDGTSAGGPEADLQNDPKTGPERPAADHPGACRSCHKQAAKEAVGAIVRDRACELNHRAFRSCKE